MKYLFLNRTMERIIINRFAAEKTDNDTRSDRIYGTQKRHKGKRPEELFYFSNIVKAFYWVNRIHLENLSSNIHHSKARESKGVNEHKNAFKHLLKGV